jgi:hypothetical protein
VYWSLIVTWSRHQSNRRIAVAIGLITSLVIQFLPVGAEAAGLQTAIMRLDRMQASTATSVLICANPASAATESSVKVTFPTTAPTDFALGAAATFTVSTATTGVNAIPTTINSTAVTAWPGIGTASSVSGKVVTFPSGDLTVGTLYCFDIVAGVTTGSAGNGTSYQAVVATYAAGPTLIDSTTVGLAVVSSDQITVTAIVPPSFQFSLSGNTDTFGSALSTVASNTTTGITATVQTNAKGGWVAWARDSNQGLRSVSANYTIPTTSASSTTTLVPGTEQFGAYLSTLVQPTNTGHCTLAVTAPYTTATTTIVGYSATFAQLASCNGGSTGTSNASSFLIIQAANISGSTPAASDYSDIITVVGAGLF